MRQSLALSSMLECSDAISANCNCCLSVSSDPPTSASQVAETKGVGPYTGLIFVFLVEMGFHHVAKAGLELLGSHDLPVWFSQTAGITGVRHHALPICFFETGSHSLAQVGVQQCHHGSLQPAPPGFR